MQKTNGVPATDYGKLAYLKTEELLRRVLYLEAELQRIKEAAGL